MKFDLHIISTDQEYYSTFVFSAIKDVLKKILSIKALQKQVVGQIWCPGQSWLVARLASHLGFQLRRVFLLHVTFGA